MPSTARTKRTKSSNTFPPPPEEDPLFLCLAAESRQRLIDAIEELPEKERLVLTLYYYEELTMREIGLTLGVVESRVSQIHSGAVRRLRSALGQPAHRADGQARHSPACVPAEDHPAARRRLT